MLAYLQVHVFTVNVVAPYTDIYMKKWHQISSTSLPERHVRVPKQSYIDFGGNFGEFVCRRVCLSARLIVGELVCRRVAVSLKTDRTTAQQTAQSAGRPLLDHADDRTATLQTRCVACCMS